MATATAAVEAAKAPIKVPTPKPFDTSSLKGKTFALIDLNRKGNPVETGISEEVDSAIASIGAKLTIFDGQGRPDVIKQAFDSAISQKVAGIIADVDLKTVPTSVAAAKAAKIPVLDIGADTLDKTEPDGVTAKVAIDSPALGKLQADAALVYTKCKLHTASITLTGTQVVGKMTDGSIAEVKKLCPNDCTIERVSGNPATLATSLPGQVQTTLQRIPDINYLITTVDFFVPLIVPALKATNHADLPIGGGAQGDGLADAIAGKNHIVSITEFPPYGYQGYLYADAMMRAAVGSPEDGVSPIRLLDSSNWGKSADVTEQFPDLPKWQSDFKKAWGV